VANPLQISPSETGMVAIPSFQGALRGFICFCSQMLRESQPDIKIKGAGGEEH